MRPAGRAPLQAQGGLRDVPAVIQAAHDAGCRDPHIGAEHLSEARMLVQLAHRHDLHSFQVEVEDQEADAGMFRRIGIGPDQRVHPCRDSPVRCPGLLAIDDDLVAVHPPGGAQAGEVAAGFRLGESLAPDVRAVENAGQPLLLLGLGAVRHHRARAMDQRHLVEPLGKLPPNVLLVVDQFAP